MNKEQIKKQAKEILDKFSSALAKVDSEKVELGVEREEFERAEGNSEKCEPEFRKRFLKNAPEHDDDFIRVERGDWK